MLSILALYLLWSLNCVMVLLAIFLVYITTKLFRKYIKTRKKVKNLQQEESNNIVIQNSDFLKLHKGSKQIAQHKHRAPPENNTTKKASSDEKNLKETSAFEKTEEEHEYDEELENEEEHETDMNKDNNQQDQQEMSDEKAQEETSVERAQEEARIATNVEQAQVAVENVPENERVYLFKTNQKFLLPNLKVMRFINHFDSDDLEGYFNSKIKFNIILKTIENEETYRMELTGFKDLYPRVFEMNNVDDDESNLMSVEFFAKKEIDDNAINFILDNPDFILPVIDCFGTNEIYVFVFEHAVFSYISLIDKSFNSRFTQFFVKQIVLGIIKIWESGFHFQEIPIKSIYFVPFSDIFYFAAFEQITPNEEDEPIDWQPVSQLIKLCEERKIFTSDCKSFADHLSDENFTIEELKQSSYLNDEIQQNLSLAEFGIGTETVSGAEKKGSSGDIKYY